MILSGRNFKSYIFFVLIWLPALLLTSSQPYAVKAQAADNEPDPAIVEAIFNALTPAERVGQLFMVSFNGANVAANPEIAELIQTYRVGGVFLSAENQNFVNGQDTPFQVLTLTNALQVLTRADPALSPVEGANDVLTATTYTPLPLFIAVNHEGDGFPYTQIHSGLTDVPSQMALGATWDPENARRVGQVVGQELSLLGINMLFGPSLDILDNPRPEQGSSLGTRVFGGHPFWVGQMGEAYIQGVHQGSNGQILTIVKHFPGFGSSDREINEGVPIIRKSLDDLQRRELLPFFRVTSLSSAQADGLTDGLMTAHVRYQGLQGNVPISLDARNLATILALKEIAPWREAGGLIVSAPLGVPAALEGISASKDSFPARLLAQNAFLAGSDVLLLADFAFTDDSSDELANIKNALGFFQEKYMAEANFHAAVDKAVRRIIKAKIKLYGNNLLETEIQQPLDNLTLLGRTPIDLAQIAQAGVTLITPTAQEGLTRPPQPGDTILIFTDDRLVRDCFDCPDFAPIPTTALQEIILQLFGPNATGQLSPEQIVSLSFVDLKNALLAGEPAEANAQTETWLASADWIIFAMLDVDTETYPQSDAVKLLLRNRYDTLRNKNLVLFAFNAPYFLDETEISQLTAYYGFYSKGYDYLEAAARLLFQQFKPAGASPVSIPAIGPLDLSPDPNQTIQLEPVHKMDINGNVVPFERQVESITTLDLKQGEGVLFRTSVIMDKNGHPIPDGTLVNFLRYYPLEGLSLEPLTATTVKGVAEIRIIKERDTPLQVEASSNLAAKGVIFNIGPGIIETPTPTPTPTLLPTDTPVPSPIPTDTPVVETPTVAPTPAPTEPPLPPSPPPRPVNFVDLVYSMLGVFVIGGIAFTLGSDRLALEERVRSTLVAIAAGLVGYILYTILAMALPKSGPLAAVIAQGAAGHWVAPLISLLFAIAGMVVWYLKPGRIFWSKRSTPSARVLERE